MLIAKRKDIIFYGVFLVFQLTFLFIFDHLVQNKHHFDDKELHLKEHKS